MNDLKGFQKKFLRGLAHTLKPVVFIGQKGLTDAVIQSANEALATHELIKLKFIEYKEKDRKTEIVSKLERLTESELAGMIGHTAILYREHPDPEKRTIELPRR